MKNHTIGLEPLPHGLLEHEARRRPRAPRCRGGVARIDQRRTSLVAIPPTPPAPAEDWFIKKRHRRLALPLLNTLALPT